MAHGTVTYQPKERSWRVQAPPHIIIRLKRVFGKLSRQFKGEIILSDTEENARDLAWFVDRYPMDCSDPVRLAERADAHRERQALVDKLLSAKVPPPDFELALPPREYQRIAAALALATGGLLLADDVGVGKTVSRSVPDVRSPAAARSRRTSRLRRRRMVRAQQGRARRSIERG